MRRIPDEIVQHQSLNIDVVSGATFTSRAIIAAVMNTVTQAGGNVANHMNRPVITRNEARTISTDILVVGSGAAGVAAAIEAAYQGVDALVIEKLGFLGGVTSTSGGMIHGANSVVMRNRPLDPHGVFHGDTAGRFAAELIDLSLGLPLPGGKAPMLTQIANLSTDTIDWLIRMGVSFPASAIDPDNLGLLGNPNRAWRGSPMSRALTAFPPALGGGAPMMQTMIDYAARQGVEFMTDTRAISLIMSGSAVTGVIARDITGAELTINARKVILATGGFHNNDTLMAAYHPLVGGPGGAGHINRWHLPGAYGEGLIMARENAGAAVVQLPTPIVGLIGAQPWGIWVTPAGNRFFDESWQYGLAAAGSLGKLGFSYHWTIMDNMNRPPALAAGADVFTAPTIPALVENMGVPAAQRAAFISNLEAAISAYNNALATGGAIPYASALGDNSVGTGADQRPRHTPIGSGPFWAQRTGVFADIWGTNSGLLINLQGQVLNTADAVIPNLYAAGEVVGWILPVQYGGSGMALTIFTNQARITGRAAAQAAR